MSVGTIFQVQVVGRHATRGYYPGKSAESLAGLSGMAKVVRLGGSFATTDG